MGFEERDLKPAAQRTGVACLGIIVADVVARPVDTIPDRGKLGLVESMELHTGGCAVNTGSALAKLGIRTGVLGKVGDDGFGSFVVDALRQRNIDTRGIAKDPRTHTSSTMVMVDSSGERTFIHYVGANARVTPGDVNWDVVANARLLHVGGFFLMPGFDGEGTKTVLRQAKELGITTSLDTAWDANGKWMPLLEPCLEYVDIFLPSYDEAVMLTGARDPEAIADAFLDRGVRVVGLKMGERGCFIKTRAPGEAADETPGEAPGGAVGRWHIPPFAVTAVDATGAGDAFVAGFLTGFIHGWEWEKVGRFANAVGASCVTAIGASAGIKSFSETLAMMENQNQTVAK